MIEERECAWNSFGEVMKKLVGLRIGITGILVVLVFLLMPTSVLQGERPVLDLLEMRHFEIEEFDHPGLDGVRLPPDPELVGALDVRLTTSHETSRPLTVLTFAEQLNGSGPKVFLAEPANIAFDSTHSRLFLVEVATTELVELRLGEESPLAGLEEIARLSLSEIGLLEPRGLAVGSRGESLFVLDGARSSILHLDLRPAAGDEGPLHLGDHRLSTIQLEDIGSPRLLGLAHETSAGLFFALSSTREALFRFSGDGRFLARHDLSEVELKEPVRLVVAPSTDLTDDPSVMRLYLTDGGIEGGAPESRITEFSFASSSPLAPMAAQAALPLTEQATLIRVIDTSAFSPPSPDTAGLAFLSSAGTILASDSEVNEMPIFTGDNLFEISIGGSLLDTQTTISFSDEPTGVAFDPATNASGGIGTVFFSDDTGTRSVHIVDLGLDGMYGTGDDVVTSIATEDFGSFDPEGVTFDTSQRVLFVVDGVNAEVYRIAPGNDGVFNGIPPGGDDVVTSFDTAGLGVLDPEGITFDSITERLYIVGEPTNSVAEVTTAGVLYSTIDISEANPRVPAGLALAPSSTNPAVMNLYIAARGVDNNSDPNENDGKIYEMAFANQAPIANPDYVTTAQDSSIGIDVAANDTDIDGNLNPATTNTACATCSNPSSGSLANNGDGTFDYTPNPGFTGPDGFLYEICDSAAECDTATVSIQVGEPPLANDDSASTLEDTAVVIDVAGNDTDPGGNLDPTTTNTTCGICSLPSTGSLINNGDGTFEYTPDPNFVGQDGFTYEICNSSALCDTASVTISVTQVNDPPTPQNDVAATPQNTSVTIAVSANDTDVDGNLDPSTANIVCPTCSPPANGILVNLGTGSFDYTPGAAFAGQDGFVYEICDTAGACATAVVSITVGVTSLQTQIINGPDDVEERYTGEMQLASSDLDLGDKAVGLRFPSLGIPPAAFILSASVQFRADESQSSPTNITIQAQDIGDAPAFTTAVGDLTSRSKTAVAVSWSPPAWTKGDGGPDQQTSDISSVIQYIVNRPDWLENNALALIITGDELRTAESLEGLASGAPVLHVDFAPVGLGSRHRSRGTGPAGV